MRKFEICEKCGNLVKSSDIIKILDVLKEKEQIIRIIFKHEKAIKKYGEAYTCQINIYLQEDPTGKEKYKYRNLPESCIMKFEQLVGNQ